MSKEPEELEFGNFRILRQDNGALWELGRGGFGTTYKAEHKHLMRTCALKVINDSRVASEDARRRFLQEARAAASLQHPHIAAVYDFGESDGTFYYAMEYCAGGDLEKFSEDKGALTWQELEPLVVQISGALLRAHESGMLHRDLKPSNIMLASDEEELPQLKLIDFGLVKILDHVKTSSTQVMMTQEGAAGFNPLTASPEQLLDEELDERSDLFSFGVTLLYLLCGGVPFGSVSAPLMMAQRLDDKSYDHLLPESLTGHGREIVSRLLQKDRDQRFRSAADILTAISNPTEIVISEKPFEPEIEPEDVVEVIEPEEESSETEIDWVSAWEVKQIQQRGRSGSYYRCAGRQQGIPDVVMFLPDEESPQIDTIIENAEKLTGLRDSALLGNYDVGHLDGERAYLSDPFLGQGGRLLDLLQAEGHFTLQTHLSLFQQISKAIDDAVELGLPGLELNATMILVDERYNGAGAMPTNSDEWLAYYREQVSQSSTFARDSSLSILPKLEEPSDEEDIQATVTLEDLATDPLTKFGSLIYRSISGMSVRPAAYMRESGYVSTSNLGEESNRFLAEIIAGRSEVANATDIIIRLCECEGVTWSTDQLDVNMHKRAATREVFASEIRGVYQRLEEALKAAKLGDKIANERKASEAAKLEKRARREKELAEKQAQEDAVKRQEEAEAKEAERVRLLAEQEQKEKERLAKEKEAAEQKAREEKEAKEAERARQLAEEEQKEKERLAQEKEAAAQKKEAEALALKKKQAEEKEEKAAKAKAEKEEKARLEKEKRMTAAQRQKALLAAEALKKKEAEEAEEKAKLAEKEAKEKEAAAKREAEAEKKRLEAQAKKDEELKREEEKRKKAEQEKKRQEEEKRRKAEDEKAKRVKIAEEKRLKAEEEKLKLAKIAEEKRLKIIQEQAAAQKQEAEKQKQILEAQKRAAEEQKQEAIKLKKETLAATKLAEREKKALEKERKEAEKAKEKIHRERQKLSAQEGGGLASKKKPLIIAGAALLAISLVTAGLISRGGDDDNGDAPSKGDSATAVNTTPDKPTPPDKPVEPSSYTMEIPLADGGKNVPDGVVLKLASPDGNIVYGQFEKKDGSLISEIKNESRPSETNEYAIQVKTAGYVMSNPVSFKAGDFVKGASNNFKLKHDLQIGVHSEFSIVPSFDGLDGDLVQYKSFLMRMLNKRDTWTLEDSSGNAVDGGKVLFDESSGEVQVSLPDGWSLKIKPVVLKIIWPELKPVLVEITHKGIDEKPWTVALLEYSLDLAKLAEFMPAFTKVQFQPVFKAGVYKGLSGLLSDLARRSSAKYSLDYDTLSKGSGKISVAGPSGNLQFTGGTISKNGMVVPNAVTSKKLASKFPQFPKQFYHGFVHVPLNPSGKKWITAPGLSSVDLSSARGAGDSAGFQFKLLFVDPKNNWVSFGSNLKVSSWNDKDGSWLLQSGVNSQLPMNLKLGKEGAAGGRSFVYTEVASADYGVTPDEPASRRYLTPVLKDGKVHASIPMKMLADVNRAIYLGKLKTHLEAIKKEYKVITSVHSYNLPKNYPKVSIKEMKVLASE